MILKSIKTAEAVRIFGFIVFVIYCSTLEAKTVLIYNVFFLTHSHMMMYESGNVKEKKRGKITTSNQH